MTRFQRLMVFLAVFVLMVVLTGGSVALAHNAAHIHLPTGECQNVGSGKHANNPDIDKIPGSGDQYGARWASSFEETPIYPRWCEEPGAHDHP